MRQVKAQARGQTRPRRAPARGKSPPRAAQPRAAKRHEPEEIETYRFDPEGALARLRESFPFRHPMLTFTLGFLGFVVIAGVFAGGHMAKAEAGFSDAVSSALYHSGFGVRHFRLTGNERTTEEAAAAAIALGEGRSIFDLDPKAARRRLLALPWVADADVARRLPDTLTVRLIEKRPFALWRDGNSVAVVERNGAVITRDGVESFHLPVIGGKGAPEAAAPFLDVLGAFKTINTRTRMIQRIGERRWDLMLDSGVIARLPEQGWEAQLAELDKLIAKRSLLDRDIEIIDLRYPDNLIFKLHNGDSRPMPRQQRA